MSLKGRVKFRILGHRVRSPTVIDDQAFAELRGQLRTQFFLPLAESLASIGGIKFSEKLRKGSWHTSRWRRYNYYRTWLAYRYGSDRARKKFGGSLASAIAETSGAKKVKARRSGMASQYFRDQLEKSNDPLNDQLIFRQFEFLYRELSRARSQTKPGYSSSQPTYGMHTQRWLKGDRIDGKGGKRVREAIDVTELYDLMKKVLDNHKQDAVDDPTMARQRLMEEARSIMSGAEVANLRMSKPGQRLLRQAEQTAVRVERSLDLLGKRSGRFTLPQEAGEATPSKRRARDFIATYKQGRRDGLNYRGRALTGGRFPFGFQTGNLADAWATAKGRALSGSSKRPHSAILRVLPGEDDGNAIPGMSLTAVLKSKIAKSGGNPAMFTRQEIRSVMSQAVAEAVSSGQWEALGVKYKGRSRR